MHLIDIVPTIRAAAEKLRERPDQWGKKDPELAAKLDAVADKVTLMIDQLYPLMDPPAPLVALKGLQTGKPGQVFSLGHGRWVTPPDWKPDRGATDAPVREMVDEGGVVWWEWDRHASEWRLL